MTLPLQATEDPLAFASKAKEAGAELLEIRGDITPLVSTFVSPLPLIISPRRTGDALLRALLPAYVDLELGEEAAVPSGTRIIRSFHDHTGTPAATDLRSIVTRLLGLNPDVVKIATAISRYADIERLSELRNLLPKDRRVILGMGTKAHISRMLSPFQNVLTYTYLDGKPSAPGQVPLFLHRKTTHCRTPRVFGILSGLDVQSLSPVIHNALFEQHGIDALYTSFPADDLEDTFSFITRNNISGFSVTTPFKQKIIEKIDELDPLAESLQSVNTIVSENGRYKGYNTDVTGLEEGYAFLKSASSVAILGSGGVVPAIIHACRELGVQDICVFARNAQAREVLANRFSVRCAALSALEQATPDAMICVINDDVFFPLPKAKKGAHAIDLRYGKATPFLNEARQKGYRTHDGIPMLLHQALAQFRYFADITPTESDFQMLLNLFPHSYGIQ
ncbi:MAG: type I 3-dehydroquinate dehydratase [Candidatus Peribacter sp.]